MEQLITFRKIAQFNKLAEVVELIQDKTDFGRLTISKIFADLQAAITKSPFSRYISVVYTTEDIVPEHVPHDVWMQWFNTFMRQNVPHNTEVTFDGYGKQIDGKIKMFKTLTLTLEFPS